MNCNQILVMSCLPSNGCGVICYEGFCGFALKLSGGLSCWGGLLGSFGNVLL